LPSTRSAMRLGNGVGYGQPLREISAGCDDSHQA
jgi:hypothetical protein